ncbi:MAG: hypothetical protein IKB01_14215 [Lachnospiraceae bacterium]|nr:hypothetical protein [Lachnospiraceae bacterium]
MRDKSKFLKYAVAFSAIFLLVFMGVIFGPIEIFFGNYKELELVFNDFGWYFILAGLVLSAIVALIMAVLPEVLRKLFTAGIWGVALAAYVQVMFLNKGLEQLGATATGFTTTVAEQWPNTLTWFAIIAGAMLIVFLNKRNWQKIVMLSSLCLVAMQAVGMISLFLTADEACYVVPKSEVCLDASEQYTVSSNENIIVFVLDNFSNMWLYEARLEDEHIIDCMNDFTYYSNAECNYFGTYPSLIHLLTGEPLDTELKTNEYIKRAWNNERTNRYFELLEKNDYRLNVYTEASTIFTGSMPLESLKEMINNVSTNTDNREVNHLLICKILVKMSCYRYAPNVLKEFFVVNNHQYSNLVVEAGEVAYYNPDFYERLCTKKITVSDEANYYNFIHLNGMHEFINDQNCEWSEDVSYIDCIRGIFKMLDEYMNQLKQNGVYDNSTIIVLADHGTIYEGQPIFFIKNKNERHEQMQETTAPIDYFAFVPTIVQILGEDYSAFGKSVYDYSDGEWRERVFMGRYADNNYPSVERYDGMPNGAFNVWRAYKYTGDVWYLISQYQLFQYETIPMVDSYY